MLQDHVGYITQDYKPDSTIALRTNRSDKMSAATEIQRDLHIFTVKTFSDIYIHPYVKLNLLKKRMTVAKNSKGKKAWETLVSCTVS